MNLRDANPNYRSLASFVVGVVLVLIVLLLPAQTRSCAMFSRGAALGCVVAKHAREHPLLFFIGVIGVSYGWVSAGPAGLLGRSGRMTSDEVVLVEVTKHEQAGQAPKRPSFMAPAPELSLAGWVRDAGGMVWWLDVPAVGPSRLVGSWAAEESMHVLVGHAGTWTADLGVHAGGCDLTVQLPSPRACVCIASAVVRDESAPPIPVRMTVDLPGEQSDARLVA